MNKHRRDHILELQNEILTSSKINVKNVSPSPATKAKIQEEQEELMQKIGTVKCELCNCDMYCDTYDGRWRCFPCNTSICLSKYSRKKEMETTQM